jgi:uncharacterized membrane protein HdeD (DUF308 family)
MIVTLEGIETLDKLVHPEKADLPRLFTLDGMLIDSSSMQPSKALSPILFAVVGMIVFLQPNMRTFVDFSIMALQLFRESYVKLFESTVMEQSPLQRKKAFRPILDTLDGIIRLVKPVQSLKAFSPIIHTLDGILRLVKLEQFSKALFPMLVTVEGIIVFLQPTINVLLAVSIIALQLFRESYFKLL